MRAQQPWFGPWWGSWQQWASVGLALLTLWLAVFSIEQAHWITPQPSLSLVLVLAATCGVLAAKSQRLSAVFFVLGLLIGALVTMWQASNLLTTSSAPTPFHRLVEVLLTTRPNESTIHFATSLVLFVWLTGYVSTWLVVRKQNAWPAVALGAAAVLVNMSYLTEKYYGFLLAYALAALLLLGQTHLANREGRFRRRGAVYGNGKGALYLMTSVLVFSLVAITVAWYTPEVRAPKVQSLVSSKMPSAKSVETYWINLFRAVPAKQPAVRSRDEDELHFDTPIDLSSNVLFVVSAKRSSYWRTWVYDLYTSAAGKPARSPSRSRRGRPTSPAMPFWAAACSTIP